MSQFDPANLSPVRTDPRACELPYGLTWDDLAPCLPGFDQRESARARAFVSYEKQGLHGVGNSCILTLRYPTTDGSSSEETLFVKHAIEGREADTYRLLAARGVPVPQLLAVISRGAAEVLVLEFLTRIGIDFGSADEVTELLCLVARLNAVGDLPEALPKRPGTPQAEFHTRVRNALAKMPSSDVDVDAWLEAFRRAEEAIGSMPVAPIHGEFFFQQVGWSGRRLVMFDLSTLSVRPRFTDVASILRPLAVYADREEVELFDLYLDALRELSGVELHGEKALAELRLLRVATTSWSLPWLTDAADRRKDLDLRSQLTMAVDCLRDDLFSLGLV